MVDWGGDSSCSMVGLREESGGIRERELELERRGGERGQRRGT
jgi:hypothetical protein